MRLSSRLLLLLASVVVSGPAAAACSYDPPTVAPDGNAVSFLFNDLSVSAGGSTGVRRAVKTCRITVPVAQGEGYSAFKADYRGYIGADEGGSGSVEVDQGGKAALRIDRRGPVDDDLVGSYYVGGKASDPLDLDLLIEAEGSLDPALFETGVSIDTVDFLRIGFTTAASVGNSANQIARQRQSIALELMDADQGLLGQASRFDDGNSLSAFGSSSAAAGFNARWEAGNGISLLGGAAYVHPNDSEADLDSLALLAGAVRYTTAPSTVRVFGEAGLWGSPNVSASLSRSYQNLDQMIFSGASASGSLVSAYGRVGMIYAPDTSNEFALSTRFTRSWLDLGGYDETQSVDNPFAAHIRSGRSRSDTLALEAAWSGRIDEALDFTLSGALGRTFAGRGGDVNVDFVGAVGGQARDQSFGSVAARLGWAFQERWQLDTTATVTVRENADTDWAVGAAVRTSF